MVNVNALINLFIRIKDENRMRNLLYGLFTPKELEEVSRRLKIVRLLKKGIPQHKIAEKLRVGVATVTRGSKEIKKGRFKDI